MRRCRRFVHRLVSVIVWVRHRGWLCSACCEFLLCRRGYFIGGCTERSHRRFGLSVAFVLFPLPVRTVSGHIGSSFFFSMEAMRTVLAWPACRPSCLFSGGRSLEQGSLSLSPAAQQLEVSPSLPLRLRPIVPSVSDCPDRFRHPARLQCRSHV